jgi:DNA-binding transcriptional LysR family regulator
LIEKVLMELRQLEVFVAVAEELHFGRAGERLHIGQSAVSQTLRRLERDLGEKLIERTSRVVALTPAGEILLTESRELLRSAARARQSIQYVRSGARGEIRIAAVSTAWSGIMPKVLGHMRRVHPEIGLHVAELGTSDQIRSISDGLLHVGLVRSDHLPNGLVAARTLDESLSVALPAAHPLASAATVELASLSGEGFVSFPRSLAPEHFDMLMSACQGVGFSPWTAYECLGHQAQLGVVSAGLGVALTTEPLAGLKMDGVVFRRVVAPEVPLRLNVVWSRGSTSALVRTVVEAVVEVGRAYQASLPA